MLDYEAKFKNLTADINQKVDREEIAGERVKLKETQSLASKIKVKLSCFRDY